MLGMVLIAQKRVAEGEPLLLSGCEGMKRDVANIRTYATSAEVYRQAVGCLVKRYQAAGHPEKAALWETEISR